MKAVASYNLPWLFPLNKLSSFNSCNMSSLNGELVLPVGGFRIFSRLFSMFWANFSTKNHPWKSQKHHQGFLGFRSLSTSFPSRFDKAIRLAEKKARFEGREDLVDTWKVPEELLGLVFQGLLHMGVS